MRQNENRCIFHPRKDGEYSGFVFSEERCQTAFYSLGTIFEENMRVPRGMQSLDSGFSIGARSISVGTRFCLQSIPATCSIEEWVEQREEMDEGLNAFIALTHKYVDV